MPSAQTPLPHSEGNPPPKLSSPISECTAENTETEVETVVSMYEASERVGGCNHIEITQQRLNLMVRQLRLSSRRATVLSQHLKTVNILAADARVSYFRQRQQTFLPFFTASPNNRFAYCNNIPQLMAMMNIEYIPEQWPLFIDSS